MTMANSTVASPLRAGASLRKTNKPLMEKRRRARINDSLSQLKTLVITGSKKDSSQFNKLEKADILELTVKHLRSLQTSQHQQQLQQGDSATGPRYQDGFMECANEVIRYLSQAPGFSDDTKCRVINHLASCLQLANTKDKAMQVATQPQMNVTNATTPTATVLNGGILATPAAAAIPAQGQIIQIVSAPPQAAVPAPSVVKASQNVHILPSPPTATVIGSNNIAMSAAPHHSNQPGRVSIPVTGQQMTAVASHYSQPLHIHIPPAFSPVLVGKAENVNVASSARQSYKQQVLQQQPMDIAPRLSGPQQSPVRPAPSVLTTSAFQLPGKTQNQSAAECSVLTITPEPTPSPKTCLPSPVVSRQQHQSKQQHQHDTPITHVHKIHGFYSSAEDFVPSRPRTFSMASSSSSSSSSVVDNELPSPLNLSSQSPPPCNLPQPRLVSKGGESAPKPRHFMDKNNNINNGNTTHRSTTTGSTKNIFSYSNSDQENMNTNINGPCGVGSYAPSQALSSVLLSSRGKFSPDGQAKYMSFMMEEDRQCTRNHGHRSRSISPASSVGEDHLWRPW